MKKLGLALVTGGVGFIGSNVVKLLLENNWQVRVVDNLSTGYFANLEGFDIDFIEGDVRDGELAARACAGADVVFHLAASVGRQRSLDDPITDSSVNLLGTINILEGMKKHGVPKIVYSSSAAIFGELQTDSIAEDHPQNADSPYGVSKLAAEKMILAYSGIYGMTGVCLRYFNIYGVNQRYDLYGNVIPIFVKRVFTGEPITIYGDGKQTRDFVNVKDIARANYLAALNDNGSNVFNVGSGSSITINHLADLIRKLYGKDTKVVYAPPRPADVLHCKSDTKKARDVLNFSAKIDMEAGLKEYMQWYADNCV
jgi:nucleoside-diphosphate-sugar epimerase